MSARLRWWWPSGLAAAVLAAAIPAAGQTVHDSRLWTAVVVLGRTGAASAGRYAFDTQFRTRDGIETADLAGVRGLIGREMSAAVSVWAGYAAVSTFVSGGGSRLEHRLLQQLIWRGRAAGASLALRTRVDERFVEDDSGVAVRVRQHVRLAWPLSPTGGLSLVVSDEVMAYARGTTRFARGFDQHRVSAGLRRTMTPRTAIEIGYVNQYLRVRSAPGRMSHVLSVTMAVAAPPG